MSFLNTLRQFWGNKLVDLDCHPRFSGTDTWSGSLFGTITSNSLDYLAADETTASRVVKYFVKGVWPYASDHRALGVELDLSLSLAPTCTYTVSRKPIGWISKASERVS